MSHCSRPEWTSKHKLHIELCCFTCNYFFSSDTKTGNFSRINIWLYATNIHQNVLALGETNGDLSGLAADVHQLRILIRNSLSQEEDGVFVLLLTHPEGNTLKQLRSSWRASAISQKGSFLDTPNRCNFHFLQDTDFSFNNNDDSSCRPAEHYYWSTMWFQCFFIDR